mmetsp:Transcript_56579/g.104727  ORF Transcript_56579/g.104727 Transcript_56579/m.104727 type:complete len:228 (-) Transcript_56579:86-769(-)
MATSLPDAYYEALDKIFSNWTVLVLAVEQGWGGRDSRAKRQQLRDEVRDVLAAGARKRRPMSYENVDDVNSLADFLGQRLLDLYYVDVEDGSDAEVAALCLRLQNTCQSGDLSFVEEFLKSNAAKATADTSKCQGVDITEYVNAEDVVVDHLEDIIVPPQMIQDNLDGDLAEGDGEQPVEGNTVRETPEKDSVQEGEQARVPKQPRAEPEVDEEGFTSVVKGRRKPR